MKKVYTTAQGKQVDIDSLRVANEQIIAVGNMKVNARGDELGPGGRVAQTRNQAMETYYKLNSQTPSEVTPDEVVKRQRNAGVSVPRTSVPVDAPPVVEDAVEEVAEEEPAPPVAPAAQAPTTRGSLAGSVAKNATVTQELLTPLNKRNGITRI